MAKYILWRVSKGITILDIGLDKKSGSDHLIIASTTVDQGPKFQGSCPWNSVTEALDSSLTGTVICS